MVKYRIGWNRYVDRDTFEQEMNKMFSQDDKNSKIFSDIKERVWNTINFFGYTNIRDENNSFRIISFFVAEEEVFDIESVLNEIDCNSGSDYNNFCIARELVKKGYKLVKVEDDLTVFDEGSDVHCGKTKGLADYYDPDKVLPYR